MVARHGSSGATSPAFNTYAALQKMLWDGPLACPVGTVVHSIGAIANSIEAIAYLVGTIACPIGAVADVVGTIVCPVRIVADSIVAIVYSVGGVVCSVGVIDHTVGTGKSNGNKLSRSETCQGRDSSRWSDILPMLTAKQ